MNISEKTRAKILKNFRGITVKLLTFILLCGLSYVILYPFLFKILAAFMSKSDLSNNLVTLIPMKWTFDNFRYVLKETEFFTALKNTFLYAILDASLATASAALVGYGIAKFKFRGVNVLTAILVVVMLMPLQTLSIPIYLNFYSWNPFGIFSVLGLNGVNVLGTPLPTVIMAATSFGFRAGIFVILMRQYYIGVPNEILEAAFVDGAGPYRTFASIVLPNACSMLVVIFSLSFAWQWTDTFYSDLLYGDKLMLPTLSAFLQNVEQSDKEYYLQFVRANTFTILAILPLIILYCILQKQIIQGIERSGLVG